MTRSLLVGFSLLLGLKNGKEGSAKSLLLGPCGYLPGKRAEDRLWWSAHDHSGSLNAGVTANRILAIDRILFPANERARI